MTINDLMPVLGVVISAFALGLSVVNYRNNIDLTRRSVLISEKKLLSEEFKEPLSKINSAVVYLLPIVDKTSKGLSFSLTDLYRSVRQPSEDVKYTNRPIAHHFSDLVLAITEEIMSEFESDKFIRVAQNQIRILNIVPTKDIYPFLDKNEKSGYKSFNCLGNKHVIINFAALYEVSNSDFNKFFDVGRAINSQVHELIEPLKLSDLLSAMHNLQVVNNTHIIKFDHDVEFTKNFHIVNNLLNLLKDDYDFGISERFFDKQGLGVGDAVLLACKLQLLVSAIDVFLQKFEPTYT